VSGCGALDLIGRPLYRPFDELLGLAGHGLLPDCRRLGEIVATRAPGLISGGGVPICFVQPSPVVCGSYEQHIFVTGEVPTRPHDWHDFFNALVWATYPRTKLAMNARHLLEINSREAAGLQGRGPVRDALTQFDECGVVVSTSVPELARGLAAHQWEDIFWSRRAELVDAMDFAVVGHASLDLLRAPFVGLCGKALYRTVSPAWFELSIQQRRAELDAWLAAQIADERGFRSPRAFSALPLLGIPGVVAESESAAYYSDIRQFRPRRPSGASPD